jgi:hypothetical protein
LVRSAEDQARAYERTDGKAFFAEVTKLMGTSYAAPGKVTPPKTSKAKTTSIPTATPKATTTAILDAKPRPAVYVSEVHGPLVPEPRKPAKKAPTKR